MKKSVTLVFGFIIILSSWWTVSNVTRPQFEQGVLDVWVTWAEDSEQLQTHFDRYAQDGLPVEVTTGIKGNKVLGAINDSTTPDVVILSSADLVKAYDQQGFIEPLNSWIETTGIDLDDFYPAALTQCTMPDGTILCLPLSSDIYALFWNKDLFEAAGIDPDRPPADDGGIGHIRRSTHHPQR